MNGDRGIAADKSTATRGTRPKIQNFKKRAARFSATVRIGSWHGEIAGHIQIDRSIAGDASTAAGGTAALLVKNVHIELTAN